MHSIVRNASAAVPVAVLFAGCVLAGSSRSMPPAHDAFFTALQEMCGSSFRGASVEAPAGDTLYTGRPMVIEVRECTDERVAIPVRVGDDASRTWMIAREGGGLRLTHIHRHADGTEDDNSRYGGVTLQPGSSWRQDFPADAFSIEQVPGRATQTWTLELWPGQVLDYSLHRVATGLRYRFRFDLTQPI